MVVFWTFFSSTETQTDEFDALMVGQGDKGVSHHHPPPPAPPAPAPPQHDPEDDDPFNPSMDTDAMLDILCSNYTQTCAGEEVSFSLGSTPE